MRLRSPIGRTPRWNGKSDYLFAPDEAMAGDAGHPSWGSGYVMREVTPTPYHHNIVLFLLNRVPVFIESVQAMLPVRLIITLPREKTAPDLKVNCLAFCENERLAGDTIVPMDDLRREGVIVALVRSTVLDHRWIVRAGLDEIAVFVIFLEMHDPFGVLEVIRIIVAALGGHGLDATE